MKVSYLVSKLIVGKSIHESPFRRTLDDVTILGLNPAFGYDLQLSIWFGWLNLIGALLIRPTGKAEISMFKKISTLLRDFLHVVPILIY